MNRVFVVQEPGDKNILPAKEFGEFRILIQGNDIPKGVDHCISKMVLALQDFNCDKDYILPCGEPLMMCYAAIIAHHFGEGRVRFLRWNRETYTYTEERIAI